MKNSLAILFILFIATVSACSEVDERVADAIAESAPTDNDNSTSEPDNADTDSSASSESSNNESDVSDDDNQLATDDSNTQSNNGECALTSVQQELLNAHNLARSEGRNCGTTFFPATTPLVWDCTLAEIADGHNIDMGTNNFFSHTGSDGLSSSDRATNAGYNWTSVGENIAAGYPDVASVVQGWLDSVGHCENLMRPSYEEMGGDIYNASGSDFPTYWTVNFGTESSF